MQPNRKIVEKQNEMGRPHGKNGCKQTSKDAGKGNYHSLDGRTV